MLCEGASQTVLGCWGTSLRSFELSTLVLGTTPASTKLSKPNGTCHRWAPTWYAGCLWHQPCGGCPETHNCDSLVDRQLWTLLFFLGCWLTFSQRIHSEERPICPMACSATSFMHTSRSVFFVRKLMGHNLSWFSWPAAQRKLQFRDFQLCPCPKLHKVPSIYTRNVNIRENRKRRLLVVDYWLQSSARPSWVLLKSQFTMGPSNLESGKQFQSFTKVIRV